MKAFPFSSILSIVLCSTLAVSPLWSQSPLQAPANVSAEPDALQLRIVDADRLQANARPGAKQAIEVEVTDSAGAPVPNAAVTCRLPDTGATGIFADGSHAAVAYTDAQGHARIDNVQWGNLPGPVTIRLTATKGLAHTGVLMETNVAAGTANAPAMASQVPAAQPVIAQPTVSVTKPVRQPGQTEKQVAIADPGPNKLTPAPADPTVSVTRTSAADAPHSSHAKWYILVAVAVAAGAGAAFAMKGKSSSSSSSNNSALTIGNPSISVGHP